MSRGDAGDRWKRLLVLNVASIGGDVLANPDIIKLLVGAEDDPLGIQFLLIACQEKPRYPAAWRERIHFWPYRKPTQVDWCKYTKASEGTLVKEFGKKASVTSGYGSPRLWRGCNN